MTHNRKRPARIVAALLAVAIAVALAACGSAGSGEATSEPAPDYDAAIAEAPPALADLYEGGAELIDGGERAYDSTLAAVRDHPVVVNNWASWCGPCREEFPYFQSQAAEHLDRVAFLGVDSADAPDAYETFLRDNPIPYPSVADPDQGLSDWTGTSLIGLPNTLFYDASGKLVYAHQGPYASEDELAADIDTYALSS